ncbi:hypothetical protein DDD_1078 [Nonlabens dokdonensis DSW-6]|uniref:Uncharacterized protein n=1 Tax=Nonlabens dokdonensis (strain DSM 17205 / KCTC 12402 / DSW-6) TaxID=592029 RepID=L7W3Q7_NONDD|nr:hypothetical protein DDD_1078 [Nonlabens dokdonensis DSW-6]
MIKLVVSFAFAKAGISNISKTKKQTLKKTSLIYIQIVFHY